MATGPGSTDAENGVKMAARDRFHGSGQAPAGDAGPAADADAGAAAGGSLPGAGSELAVVC
jgi:hypothetical protein